METKELKGKSLKELKRFLRDSREKLRQLRFDLISGKVKDVGEIRRTKKNIARALTILWQKEKLKEK